MVNHDVRSAAATVHRQARGESPVVWSSGEWEANVESLLRLIRKEESALRLGDVLRFDLGLEMPISVVRATYARLFELGADDVHTKLCYARYLLLHGPDWDTEAEALLREVEPTARAAGLWDSPTLGHHPVFFRGKD